VFKIPRLEHMRDDSSGCVGVLGGDPATRWISIDPPTSVSRPTGARSDVHLFSSLREAIVPCVSGGRKKHFATLKICSGSLRLGAKYLVVQ
jgi:hypothetical protein